MKKYIVIFLFFLYLENSIFAETLESKDANPLTSSKIKKTFGLLKPHSSLLEIGIGVSLPEEKVLNLENGNLLYFDEPSESFYPSSNKEGLVVIQDKDKKQWHYSNFSISRSLLPFSFHPIPKEFSLGKSSFFSLKVNRQDRFMNPLDIPNFPLQDIRPYNIKLDRILLESGIYTREVHSTNLQKILLRKNYSIYIGAYEQAKERGQLKSLPVSIHVIIRSASDQTVVFEKQIKFYSIQNNLINGVLDPNTLYRKYWNDSMIKVGIWDTMKRTKSYYLEATVIGSNGEKDSLSFPIQFY